MKIAIFSCKPYDRKFFNQENSSHKHTISYFDARLSIDTAALASGFSVVCGFVNDEFDSNILEILKRNGTSLIALRCAGFNNVDLATARSLKMEVIRVPSYSPHAVAEHALALILTLNRKTHRAFNRTREGNFSLDGLLGFDLKGKTVGVIGTGEIGSVFATIMHGLGCQVIACDPLKHQDLLELGVTYVELEEIYQRSDIISLHCPLNKQTKHMINVQAIELMKKGVMLINTGRGALIETIDLIRGLKSQHIGYVGLDVYEEEAELFFEDNSGLIIQDDVFMRLLTFPNVLITGHQGFFTDNALSNIARTTLENISFYQESGHTDGLTGSLTDKSHAK